MKAEPPRHVQAVSGDRPVASPTLRLVAPGEAAEAEALLYEAFISFARKLGREPSRVWYTRLPRHVEAEAWPAGASSLHLDTAAMMSDLLRLYDRHGFKEVRRGPPGHGRDRHIRVFMEKRL